MSLSNSSHSSVSPQRLETEAVVVGRVQAPIFLTEWTLFATVVAVCVVSVVGLHWWSGALAGIPSGLMAVAITASVAAGPMFWRRGGLGRRAPVVSTLMTITFRMLVMLGALGFVAATKWPHRNSFAWTLLGCYFIFLILESAFSIRWYSSSHPRAEQP